MKTFKFFITLAMVSKILLSANAVAANNDTEIATMEIDRKAAQLLSKQWAKEYVARHSGSKNYEARVKNVQCRIDCLTVVFEDEFHNGVDPHKNKCVIVLDWTNWKNWERLLGTVSMKDDLTDPLDQEFFLKRWFNKTIRGVSDIISSFGDDFDKIDAGMKRYKEVHDELTRECN